MLQERLSLVAELAIALAGFASIVAIIGRRQGRDSTAIDAIRLQWMLGLSLFTTRYCQELWICLAAPLRNATRNARRRGHCHASLSGAR